MGQPALQAVTTAAPSLLQYSAAELARLYRQRELSPVEVTRAVLARSEARQADLNAFAALDAPAAMAAAEAAERRFAKDAPLGPLDGIPIAVKDLIDVRGFVTRRGSLSTAQQAPAAADAPAVARLREQGAVLFGKTTTHEFGLGSQHIPHTGLTRSPWDVAHRPGGSSAGAVAAVAAGLGPLGLGTDGGGSIREPASNTGLVGFKPSFGWVAAQTPGIAGAPPLVGPIANTVADAIVLFRAIAQRDPRDPYSLPAAWRAGAGEAIPNWQDVRIAIAPAFNGVQASAEVAAAFDAAVAVFVRLGARVERAIPPAAPDSLRRLMLGRAALTVRALTFAQRSRIDPAVEEASLLGEGLTALDYVAAEADRAAYTAQLAAFFERHDLLLTPTTARVAAPIEGVAPRRGPSYVAPFSWTRQPAISVPAGLGNGGAGAQRLPIGLQIVGRLYEDEFVLAAALAYEAAADHLAPLRQRAIVLRA